MIDMQVLNSALMALVILVGIAITLSVAMVAAAAVTTRRGQAPHGGIRRDLPQEPTPDGDDARELVIHHDDARELVLR